MGLHLHIADIIEVDNNDRVLTINVLTNADKVFGLESDVCKRDALGSNADIGELNMLGKVDGFVRHFDPRCVAVRRTELPLWVE